MMRFGSVRKYILGLLFSVSALLALISSSARIYAQRDGCRAAAALVCWQGLSHLFVARLNC
jgi:hypothetical protein